MTPTTQPSPAPAAGPSKPLGYTESEFLATWLIKPGTDPERFKTEPEYAKGQRGVMVKRYECDTCQFDTTVALEMTKHLQAGQHPWGKEKGATS